MPKASSTFSIKTAKAILAALKPATEAAMGGRLTDVHPIACGFEGCAFSAEHPKLGHVVLKVGRLRQDKMERYDPMLDKGARKRKGVSYYLNCRNPFQEIKSPSHRVGISVRGLLNDERRDV